MSVVHVLLTAFAWLGAGIFAAVHAPAMSTFRVDAPVAAGAAAPKPPTELLDYGLFGTLHLSRPAGEASGTVLFFSDREDRRVTHVGIATGDGRMVHSGLARGGVAIETMAAGDAYTARLREQITGVRRVI